MLIVMIWPALLAGGVALAGYLGRRKSNRINIEEAQKSRDFSERMSSTQWQRGVADMEAAGVNPALAYSQGGASSPQGAQGRVESETEGLSSAAQLRSQQAQIDLLNAQKKKVDAETEHVDRQVSLTDFDDRIVAAKFGQYFYNDPADRANFGKARPEFQRLLQAQHQQQIGSARQAMAQATLTELSEAELKAVSALFDAVGAPGKGGAAGIKMIIPALLTIFNRRR